MHAQRGTNRTPRCVCPSSVLSLLVAATALVLPACESDGQFHILGYTTEPQYDRNIHTVHVPIFTNLTFWRDMEFELTRAVVREIEAKTPYKVVSDESLADTVLTGTIISYNKNLLNRNQLNEVREAETTLAVEVMWKNKLTGEVLSQPQRPPGPFPAVPSLPPQDAPPGTAPGTMPTAPLGAIPGTPPPPPPPPPVLVQSIGGFIPELGGSLSWAQRRNVNRLAIQIVSMMEKPW